MSGDHGVARASGTRSRGDIVNRYRTIVADPPWPYEARFMGPRTEGGPGARPMPYTTMSLSTIADLGVGSFAAPGAHVYLWTTQRFLWDVPPLMRAWGCRPLKVLTWCKEPVGQGPGGSFANTTEFCVFGRALVGATIRVARRMAGLSQNEVDLAVRGRVTRLAKRWEDDDCYPSADDWTRLQTTLPALTGELTPEPARCPTTWWLWPRGRHSEKPEAFLDLVERISPGPYLELFARRDRLGWDTWGDESLGTAELSGAA